MVERKGVLGNYNVPVPILSNVGVKALQSAFSTAAMCWAPVLPLGVVDVTVQFLAAVQSFNADIFAAAHSTLAFAASGFVAVTVKVKLLVADVEDASVLVDSLPGNV